MRGRMGVARRDGGGEHEQLPEPVGADGDGEFFATESRCREERRDEPGSELRGGERGGCDREARGDLHEAEPGAHEREQREAPRGAVGGRGQFVAEPVVDRARRRRKRAGGEGGDPPSQSRRTRRGRAVRERGGEECAPDGEGAVGPERGGFAQFHGAAANRSRWWRYQSLVKSSPGSRDFFSERNSRKRGCATSTCVRVAQRW